MRYNRHHPFGTDARDRAALIALRADGGSVADVCREFGVCRATASLGLRRIGQPGRRGPKNDPMLRARVLACLRDGCRNGAEVSRALGYARRNGVCRVLKQLKADGLIAVNGVGRHATTSLTSKWTTP